MTALPALWVTLQEKLMARAKAHVDHLPEPLCLRMLNLKEQYSLVPELESPQDCCLGEAEVSLIEVTAEKLPK